MKRNAFRKLSVLFWFTIGCLFVTACDEPLETPADQCTVMATLKDYSGLSACGWMLELEDGTVLDPVSYQGASFDEQLVAQALPNGLQDGMAVSISYNEVQVVTACMAGVTVDITCISPVQEN